MSSRWRPPARFLLVLGLLCSESLLYSAFAEESTVTLTGTRIEWIKKKREDKEQNLRPAKPDAVEAGLQKYIGDDPLNKYMGGLPGLRLKLGGLPGGGGFNLGPEYYRTDLARGQTYFQTFATGSSNLWYLIEMNLRFPHLAGRHLDLNIHGHRLDANSVDYYGPGPDSNKAQHTDFRREENALNASLAIKPVRRYLSLGLAAAYLWLNTGPGRSDQYSSSEKQFSPDMAPGIDKQTNYLKTGIFLDIDSRDEPKDPHAGTHFRAEVSRFSDRIYDRYSFRQIESSIEHYISFFNEKRVIALRARSIFSYPFSNSEIPFYMQPTLGGSSDLRGYHRYRFYDDNSFVMNAEFRWHVFTLMDAAIFADAGKVFHRDGDFSFKDLESNAGFGLRFKSRHAVVFRIDTAFSHEGPGIWFAFDNVF